MAEARQAEQTIQAGDYRRPLHGIQIGVMDLYNTAGVRTAVA
jgi:aspartyl-tRNA(Asn)/glutamyl-tRNA(Gln) amidotransferase subunit A